MGSLVTQATSAYTTWKASKTVSTMNESELSNYSITDAKFQNAISDATAIETTFYAARDEAIAALESTYQTNRSALLTLWQSKEDNGFDTTYTGV